MLIYQTGSTLSLFVFTLFGQQDDPKINKKQSTLEPEKVKRIEKRNLKKSKDLNLGFFDLTFSKWFIHSLQFEKTSFLPPPPSIVPYSSPPLRFVVPFAADHLVEVWSWNNLSTKN